MKRSRFSEEQIIGILKEHQAGLSAQDLCRKHGISDATFYKWRSKYGGMDISDARRLKALEEENRKLKKLLAESMLDAATLKEMLGKNFFLRPGRGERRELGDQGQTLLAAACVRVGRPGAEDLPLCLEAA
jgi:putative transposase